MALALPDPYPDASPGVQRDLAAISQVFPLGAASLQDDLSALVEAVHEVGAAGEPAFENSWANFAGGHQVAGFYKDAFGRVHLQGLVAGGTIPATIFTLPEGYRPDTIHLFIALEGTGGVGRVDVNADGTVDAIQGNNTVYQLNGFSFRVS